MASVAAAVAAIIRDARDDAEMSTTGIVYNHLLVLVLPSPFLRLRCRPMRTFHAQPRIEEFEYIRIKDTDTI